MASDISGARGHRAAGQKAGSAIDWATLRWKKRYGSLFPALGACDGNFDPLFDSGNVGRGDRRQPIILRLFAWLATFRFVLETLVVEKDLLAGSPNEWLGAIDAGDRSVLKVRRLLSYDLLRPAV